MARPSNENWVTISTVNPVASAAALAMLDALKSDGVIENAAKVGAYLIDKLRAIARGCDKVAEVRGQGMMIGVVLKQEARPIVDWCLKQRLLVNAAGGNVLRLLPPLNLTVSQADEGLAIIRQALLEQALR